MWIDVNHDHLKALWTMDFLNLFYLNCSFSVVARTRSVPARCVHHCAQNYTSIIRRNEPTYEKTLRRAYCVWAKGRAIIYPDSDFRVASYRQTPSSAMLATHRFVMASNFVCRVNIEGKYFIYQSNNNIV